MANFDWQDGTDGDWGTGADWGGTTPDSTAADATIAGVGIYGVTISAGETFTVDSLTLANPNAGLLIDGALDLGGAEQLLALDSGVLEIGGLVSGGTIDNAGGTVLLDSGAVLQGVTFIGDLDGPGGGTISITGGLTVESAPGAQPGTINLANFHSELDVLDGETLDNVVINLTGGYDKLDAAGAQAFTLGAGASIWVDGAIDFSSELSGGTLVNAGAIAVEASGLLINPDSFTNTGQISVASGTELDTTGAIFSNRGGITAAAGAQLVFEGQSLTNAGTITAGAGAEVSFDGSLVNTGLIGIGAGAMLNLSAPDFQSLGQVAVAGGTVRLTTGATLSQLAGISFTDSGASTTLLDIGVGGALDLGGEVATLPGVDTIEIGNGATLANGTVDNAVMPIELDSGALLENITYLGDLTGPATGAVYVDGVTIKNAAGLGPGTIDLSNYGDVLVLLGAQTLDNLVIDLGTTGGDADELIDASSAQVVEYFDGPVTINADGDGANFSGLVGETFVSNAVIDVSGTGFQVAAEQFTNAGQIDTGLLAELLFDGGTVLNSGTIDAGDNALVDVTATLDNTGLIIVGPSAILDLDTAEMAMLGTVSVQGGTIELSKAAALAQFSGVTMRDSEDTSTLFDVVAGGTLALGGAVVTISGADVFEVDDGGILSNGTIEAQSAPVELASGATLNRMTYIGGLDMPSGLLNITGGLDVENAAGGGLGTIEFGVFGGVLSVQDSETLNDVVISLASPGQLGLHFLEAGSADAPVTLGQASTIIAERNSVIAAGLEGDTFVNAGLIEISGPSFSIDPLAFANTGQISVSGAGALTFSNGYFANLGTISALSGGDVMVNEAVYGAGEFIIDPATLSFAGAVAAGQIISFGGGGVLELGDAGQFAGTITGLTMGDTIKLDGFNVSSETFVSGTGLVLNDGALTLRAQSTMPAGDFEYANNGAQGEVFVICYLKGTRIATPAGEVAIEDLAIGDAVVTRFGGVQRIRWIGRQRFDGRFLRRNRDVAPVRIAAGALAEGVPARDLYVSGGHSMLLGGMLVLARDLVNGVSITQDWAPEVVEYYQLEFFRHDCVLAEGAWSESYADCEGMRAKFHNAAEYAGLYGPRRAPARPVLCAARPECGPMLAAALMPVVERAAARRAPGRLEGWVDRVSPDGLVEGWAWDAGNPALPVLLEVVVDGEVVAEVLACETRADVARAGKGQGRCGFAVRVPGAAPGGVVVRRAGDGAALGMVEALRARVG